MMSPTQAGTFTPPRRRSRGAYLIPLAVFGALAVAFAVGLTLDPRIVPSALIGKAVPEFSLPPVKGRTAGLSSGDLRGQVSLVNVFASWCTECRAEHPILMELSRSGIVPLYGINYKDKPEDAANWLDTLGDPYARTGADVAGGVSIDWGVYGVPETFLVDRDGLIRLKHIGALNWPLFDKKFRPLLDQLRQSGP